MLTDLIDQSVVIVDDQTGHRRFRMLETLRQYGWERLLETGEAADVQRRHLAWYLEMAEQSNPELPGTQHQPGLTQLEAEHDNLRIALAWSLHNDPQSAMRLAACLAEVWRRGGHHAEGRDWLNTALAASNRSSGSGSARARISAELATWQRGMLVRSARSKYPWQKSACGCFREAGDQRGLVDALQHLGRCLYESGKDVAQVESVFEDSLRVAQTTGDQHGIGFALANLADLMWLRVSTPKRSLSTNGPSSTSARAETRCSLASCSVFSAGTPSSTATRSVLDGTRKKAWLSCAALTRGKQSGSRFSDWHTSRGKPGTKRGWVDFSRKALRFCRRLAVLAWPIGSVSGDGSASTRVSMPAESACWQPVNRTGHGSGRYVTSFTRFRGMWWTLSLATAQSALGEAALRAPWAEGKGLSTRFAVSAALSAPGRRSRRGNHWGQFQLTSRFRMACARSVSNR